MTTTTTRTLTKIYQKGRYCSDNSHGDICPCNICPRDNCHASRSTVYLSCYWSDFDHILKVVLCDYSELVTTVKMTFLQATFVLVTNCQLSRSTRTNVFFLSTCFGTNFFKFNICQVSHFSSFNFQVSTFSSFNFFKFHLFQVSPFSSFTFFKFHLFQV